MNVKSMWECGYYQTSGHIFYHLMTALASTHTHTHEREKNRVRIVNTKFLARQRNRVSTSERESRPLSSEWLFLFRWHWSSSLFIHVISINKFYATPFQAEWNENIATPTTATMTTGLIILVSGCVYCVRDPLKGFIVFNNHVN